MKVFTSLKAVFFIFSCFGMLSSFAQINMPPLSPRSEIIQNVGFGTIRVDYSRPSMRGRVIFGDLVPFNELWRTGANECTTISFSENVFIEEQKVPAGKYSLFTIPSEKNWTIVLNKDANLWGTNGYDKKFDLLRFDVMTEPLPEHVETFTIWFGDLTQATARMYMEWENTMVSFMISTDADQRIVTEIEDRLRDPMVDVANTYYSSANYYLLTNRDLDQALTWIDKAIEINGEKSFYLNLKAKVYARQDKYGKAVQVARKALELAKLEKNEYQVMLNEKLIEKWKDAAGGI
jgi:hypothetical protein